jgi:membrane protease YdiL (CAAX protease family)
MSLEKTLKKQGRWLFKRRSFLPLFALVAGAFGLLHHHYPRRSHRLDQLWEIGCLLVSLLGLSVRIIYSLILALLREDHVRRGGVSEGALRTGL